MYTNKMTKQLVKIVVEGKKSGSGVIFVPFEKSDYYYVLTAKHNFPKEILEDQITTSLFEISIMDSFRSTSDLPTNELFSAIGITDLKSYFFKLGSDFLDLALLIFKTSSPELLGNISPLNIYNSFQDDKKRNKFYLLGYPLNLSDKNFDQKHENIFSSVDDYQENTFTEILKDTGSTTTQSVHKKGYYGGMSGGGVFFQDKHQNVQLKSIIKKHTGDSFSCLRLDELAEAINEKIRSYPLSSDYIIKVGESLFADGERIDLDQVTNFDFFRDDIEQRLQSKTKWEKLELESFHMDYDLDKKDIIKIGNILRKRTKILQSKIEDLSYFFAYLAINSHKNQDRRLTSNYFSEAIELNEKHAQAFLLEKALRKDQIEDIIVTDLPSVRNKYRKLLESYELDDFYSRREVLKRALSDARKIDKNNSSSISKDFKKNLAENYKNDPRILSHYKYNELGGIYIPSEKKIPKQI